MLTSNKPPSLLISHYGRLGLAPSSSSARCLLLHRRLFIVVSILGLLLLSFPSHAAAPSHNPNHPPPSASPTATDSSGRERQGGQQQDHKAPRPSTDLFQGFMKRMGNFIQSDEFKTVAGTALETMGSVVQTVVKDRTGKEIDVRQALQNIRTTVHEGLDGYLTGVEQLLESYTTRPSASDRFFDVVRQVCSGMILMSIPRCISNLLD